MTVPTLSASEPFVDRFRRVTPKWFPWLKQLFDTLREVEVTANNAVTVTQFNELIDPITAKWGVEINGSGQLVGLVQLDNVGAYSTFTVVADKFLVAHPTSTGTTIQAFGIGLVNGVSTVGINGNVVIDGTILARHISVSTLSALTANIGTVTAGIIQSADGRMVINLNAGSIRITA